MNISSKPCQYRTSFFLTIHCLIVLCKYLWNKSPKSSWKRSCSCPVNTPNPPDKFSTGFVYTYSLYFLLLAIYDIFLLFLKLLLSRNGMPWLRPWRAWTSSWCASSERRQPVVNTALLNERYNIQFYYPVDTSAGRLTVHDGNITHSVVSALVY